MTLTDPLVNYAITFLTGLIPFGIYLLAAQKKLLGYSVLKNDPIITINQADIAGRIAISLDGKPITGLRSIQILLQNIGAKDIEHQDVYLSFPPPIKIIGSQYIFDPPLVVSSPHLEVTEANSHRLNLELMNPGDKVLVNFLTINNETGRISLTAKGPNLKFKRFEPKMFVSPVINRTVGVLYSLLFLVLFISYMHSQVFLDLDGLNKIGAVLIVGFLLIGGGSFFLHEKTISIIRFLLLARAKSQDNLSDSKDK